MDETIDQVIRGNKLSRELLAGYNQRLSEARAKSVREYLIGQGIAAKRLTAKGLGSTQPLASNATEEGRQRNRRTEFRFLR